MITQLIKFGRVVKVCTIFLTGPFLTSFRSIAKNIGSGENNMPKIANINVLPNDLHTFASVNMSLKYSRPTNSLSFNLTPGT